MAAKKIISVIGATGSQGGGLVRAILNDPESDYSVRALTRNVNSDKVRELVKLGAEVVAVDLDDPESVKRGFDKSFGVYCVTFYWAHFSPEKELAHAWTMAEAAQYSGAEHVIWSTLEDTRKWIPLGDNRMPTLQEKYKVPHFDAKGEADHFFEESGVPTTYLIPSFYWENMIYFGMGPKKDENGILTLTFPMGDKKLAGIAAEDIGKCAYGIFKAGRRYIGKKVGIAGDHLTGSEMARELGKALGQDVRYNDVPPEVYRGFGFPGADDLGNMFQFYRDFEKDCLALRNLEVSRALNPTLMDFTSWLARYKDRIPIA